MKRFIDLFAGIGGFRLGFEQAGFQCVFSSEVDKACRDVYESNFGDCPCGDIREVVAEQIPDFDVLCAGFPCQPFSKSGLLRGFDDVRGTLFYEILRIVKIKNPSAVVLENVANLLRHDSGKTFEVIKRLLVEQGYSFSYALLNSKDFGLAQNRERLVMVALRNSVFDFDKVVRVKESVYLRDILDGQPNEPYLEKGTYTLLGAEQVHNSMNGLRFCGYLNKNVRNRGVNQEMLHLSRTHRQSNRIYSADGLCPTLVSSDSCGRYYIHISESDAVRKLTVSEWYKLMGFPVDFTYSTVKGTAFKQCGNSVAVPMIRAVAESLIEYLC